MGDNGSITLSVSLLTLANQKHYTKANKLMVSFDIVNQNGLSISHQLASLNMCN